MITKLLTFINSFKKPKSVIPTRSFTTEPVSKTIESKDKLLSELVQKQVLSHDELVTLTHMCFGVTFKKSFYRLKDFNAYGVFFSIISYQLVLNANKLEVDDVIIFLADTSGNTSLKMSVSVKQLNELFISFMPDFSFMQSNR